VLDGERADTLFFTADGARALTGSMSAPPRLWAFGYAPVGPPIRVVDGRVTSVAISATNQVFVASKNGTIVTMSEDGLVINSVSLGRRINSIDVSPDSKWLAFGGPGPFVTLMNTVDKTIGRAMLGDEFSRRAQGSLPLNHEFGRIKFLPTGERFVATSSWRLFGRWTMGAERPELEIPFAKSIMDVAFSKDGKRTALALADVTHSPTIVVLSDDGTIAAQIDDPMASGLITHLAFIDRDGRRLATSSLHEIQIRHLDNAGSKTTVLSSLEHAEPVGIAPIHGGRALVAALVDGSLRAFALEDSQSGTHAMSQSDEFKLMDQTRLMALAPDESLIVTGSEKGAVTFWRNGLQPIPQRDADEVEVEVEVPASLVSGALPPLFCGASRNQLTCWDHDDGATPVPIPQGLGAMASGALHRTRMLIATAHVGGGVLLSSLGVQKESPKEVRVEGMTGWLRWSSDGRRLYMVGLYPEVDRSVLVIDVPSDFQQSSSMGVRSFKDRIMSLTALDGGRFALEFEHRIDIFTAGDDPIESIALSSDCHRGSRFSPILIAKDGERLILACANRIEGMHKVSGRWDIAYQSPLPVEPISMCFAESEKRFLSGDASGELRAWDSASGQPLEMIPFGRAVTSVNASGDIVVATSESGESGYFSISTGEILGRTVASLEGITTVSESGWFASTGTTVYEVIAFDGDRRLSNEATARRFSSAALVRDLFGRDQVSVKLLASALRFTEMARVWFTAQTWYEKLMTAFGIVYGTFILAIVALWGIRPALLCTWGMKLSGLARRPDL
jgi:WD40 repeat protein